MKRFQQAVLTLLLAVSSLAGTARAEACSRATPGLVSWWALDGSMDDAVNGNGPMSLCGATFPAGMVGRGVAFSPGGHIDIPHSESLALQRFTLEAWVRPDGPGTNNDIFGSVIVQKLPPPPLGHDTVSLGLWWDAIESRFHFGFGDIWAERITSINRFPAGQFHHVAATYDGLEFRLYVDGQLEGARSVQKTLAYDASMPWTIGSTAEFYRNLNYGRTWNGVIDEVAIHGRALSAEEVAAIVQARSAGRCRTE